MSTPKRWQNWQKQAAIVRERQAALRAQIAGDVELLATQREDATAAATAREIGQTVAEDMQQRAVGAIANVVTKCLAAVFVDDPYEFVIEFEQKRGRTEAKLLLKRGDELVPPLDAAGGGVVDVAAFALRMAAIAAATPRRRRLVVMDEPFRFVSKDYRPALCAMLEALAADMGFQFIFVTHIPELAVGNVVEVG